MRHILLPVLCALAISNAVADEIVLKSGTIGNVTVVDTTRDSVKVKGQIKGADFTATIRAADLDRYSFYTIRQKHMKRTAESCLDLALFCANNEMFARGKALLDEARRLDAAYVEKRGKMPGVREGVANKLLAYVRKQIAKGDLSEAERWLEVVKARFADVPSVAKAVDVLAVQLTKERLYREAAAERARREKIEKATSDAERKAAEGRMKALAPIRLQHQQGHRLTHQALRERNSSGARRLYEKAAGVFDAARLKAEVLIRSKGASDEALAAEATKLRDELTRDTVEAYLDAGGIALGRTSFTQAEQYARKALLVDPQNAKAKAFLGRVQLAKAINEERR